MYQKLAIETCKKSINRYLVGLIADIFLMLYKVPGILEPSFVEGMLTDRRLWTKNNTFSHSLPKEHIPQKKLKPIENYEKDGLIVEYYVPKSNTVVVSLHSYYLSSSREENGFSKMRDLIIKQVLSDP
jgi:hypothetical protein